MSFGKPGRHSPGSSTVLHLLSSELISTAVHSCGFLDLPTIVGRSIPPCLIGMTPRQRSRWKPQSREKDAGTTSNWCVCPVPQGWKSDWWKTTCEVWSLCLNNVQRLDAKNEEIYNTRILGLLKTNIKNQLQSSVFHIHIHSSPMVLHSSQGNNWPWSHHHYFIDHLKRCSLLGINAAFVWTLHFSQFLWCISNERLVFCFYESHALFGVFCSPVDWMRSVNMWRVGMDQGGLYHIYDSADLQRQTAVTAYLKNKQLLLFVLQNTA